MAGAGIWLIPRWGAPGAAAALLISLAVALVQNYFFTFALVYRSRLGGAAARTAVAAVIMGVAIWAVRPFLPWPSLIVIGTCLYVPLLFLLHVLGGEDVAAIKEILGFGGRNRKAGPGAESK